jgi:hypothetical protein
MQRDRQTHKTDMPTDRWKMQRDRQTLKTDMPIDRYKEIDRIDRQTER